MKKRKSPHKHTVRAHKRLGRPVRKYERGKGRKPAQPAGRRRRVGSPVVRSPRRSLESHSPGMYDITITYFDRDVERFDVDAENYVEAITMGVEGREEEKAPQIIKMRG